jgi:hypothetical protein
MKKLLFLIVAALCIIVSCTKDSGFGPGSGLSPALSKGLPANVPVVLYSPSADGDDTDELTALIGNAAPGTIIKLSEGEYHTGPVEIYGFQGQISGAGIGKTVFHPSGLIDGNAQIIDRNLITSWWRIIGGDVIISDLSFKTGDGPLISDVDPVVGCQALLCVISVNNYSADYGADDPPFMNFTLKNVKITCGLFSDPSLGYLGTAYNVIMPIWAGGVWFWPPEEGAELTKGNYKVIDCIVENGFDAVEFFSFGEEATGIIDNLKAESCGYGIYMTGNFGSKIFITNSVFSNSSMYDIMIEDTDWGLLWNIITSERSQFVITDNRFNVTNSISSVALLDNYVLLEQSDKLPMQFTIKGNQFNLSEGSIGISAWNSQDILIRNNSFSGACEAGITVDGKEVTLYDLINNTVIASGTPWAKNALILGNNFRGLNPATAAVVLGEKSMDCTVVGTGNGKVVDDGVNNTITGMKMLPGGLHLGPTIKDNFILRPGMRSH